VKTASFIAAILLSAGFVHAQPDPDAVPPPAVSAVTATNAEAPRTTQIDSDSAEFDLNQRTAVYHGHVHVTDPQMTLTCDWLTADLPQAGHIDQIIARTNVAIDFVQDGQTTHVTGDNAVYHYQLENGVTNETVTLTGNPRVINPREDVTAETIIWDRLRNGFQFKNIHAIENIGNFPATNAPGIIPKSKPKPADTNAPMIDTNQPVG